MGHYDFKQDLRDAHAVEWELAFLLYSRGRAADVRANDDKRFDLEVLTTDSKRVTIELKHDMMYSKTGNLGVEFASWGKPSGIAVTEADYWCFALEDGFWTIKTEELRRLIDENWYFRVAVGGDVGSNTHMYLFKGPVLKELMTFLGGRQSYAA